MPIRIRDWMAAISLVVAAPWLSGEPTRAIGQGFEVVIVTQEPLPEDPLSAAWESAPEFLCPLVEQTREEPQLTKPSTEEVSVRAITDGRRLAIRLQWADTTRDELADAARFCDACAIQLPAKIEAGTSPGVLTAAMGQPGNPVEITYWSASSQASVNGRGDSLNDLYPNAAVDHYPFQAPSLRAGSPEQRAMALRYAPARALGNPVAGPHATPVQDLIAEGPGTIAASPRSRSTGQGQRTEDGWVVVIARPLPQGLTAESPSFIAFAVWEGSNGEVGSRKMITGWVPLIMQKVP